MPSLIKAKKVKKEYMDAKTTHANAVRKKKQLTQRLQMVKRRIAEKKRGGNRNSFKGRVERVMSPKKRSNAIESREDRFINSILLRNEATLEEAKKKPKKKLKKEMLQKLPTMKSDQEDTTGRAG